MAVDPIAQTVCPLPLTLAAVRGDSIEIRLRLFNGATGSPIVLTGYAGTLSIYDSPTATIPKHLLTVDVDQAAAGNPTTGVVTITAAGGETILFLEEGFFALVLDNGTTRKTIIAGPWKLSGPSIAPSSFACSAGLCPTEGVDFPKANGQCDILPDGYTRIVLPFPVGDCC